MFCPELQKLLKPIYGLTGKGRSFIWGEEQQEAFEEIKRPQYYICLIERVDFTYTLTQVSFLQEALYIKFKMVSPINNMCK